ncbi:small ribosomal subunit protein eS10z-like [Rutidosis leptorrhynchoides]|uniref:small ribosomal subunit protein eS10z-like n=1 Tax=Rutidosis leptorrhynchoides TaxID=125765 RepID=UPI003A9A01FA
MAALIPILEKNRHAIFSKYLFEEGICFAKMDEYSTKHPEIDAPNSEVIKLMHKFESNKYVNCTSTRRHHYWYLTYDGIEFLRTYLNLPSDIVPATFGRPSGGPPGDRPQ